MALALVRLEKKRGENTYYFLDYISAGAAKLGAEIQGQEHSNNEWSKCKILKIYE